MFSSHEDIFKQFDIEPISNINILYAVYNYESYNGEALVIFKDEEGKLYEVNSSHCSCNGLEGTWSPEETSFPAILIRDDDYYLERYPVIEELQKLVKQDASPAIFLTHTEPLIREFGIFLNKNQESY